MYTRLVWARFDKKKKKKLRNKIIYYMPSIQLVTPSRRRKGLLQFNNFRSARRQNDVELWAAFVFRVDDAYDRIDGALVHLKREKNKKKPMTIMMPCCYNALLCWPTWRCIRRNLLQSSETRGRPALFWPIPPTDPVPDRTLRNRLYKSVKNTHLHVCITRGLRMKTSHKVKLNFFF